ncbi:MAG: tetratricopeptide repeat protein [Spirochaetia bacterium]|nr:tetratricopeptide repeat protein [Spirochaetota bacterium]MCX8096547.1 tetratricopeptide repeat protein [Spirochaetota bacterium]MDW8112130.1 tetratricopeptide repeat protein [Spirochaetia bacterium]
MEDLVILGAFAAVIMFVVIIFLFRSFVQPLKLDAIKKKIDDKNYVGAIADLEEYIKKDEKNPLAHLYLADCYYMTNKRDLALVEYRQALSLGKFSNQSIEKQARYRMADIYVSLGQVEEAQKEFLLIVKMDPNDYKALYNIGKIFYERNMRDNALNYLSKAVKINSSFPDAWFYMGKIHLDANKYAEAMNAFINCVKNDPKNYEAHYNLGVIYKAMNNATKALQEFEIAERSPDTNLKLKAIYQIGLIASDNGNYDKAISEFQRALKYATEENNTTIGIRYALASVYENRKQILEAIEQWERISQYRPNYLDVQEKLLRYSDLRMDDKLKDFVTCSTSTFEILSQKVLSELDYDVIDSKVVNDNTVHMVALERSGKWSNVRQGKVFVVVTRSGEPVDDDILSLIVDKVKAIHGVKGLCITTSRFTPKAIRYAENRPVALIDRNELTKVLKKI